MLEQILGQELANKVDTIEATIHSQNLVRLYNRFQGNASLGIKNRPEDRNYSIDFPFQYEHKRTPELGDRAI